MIIDSHCHLDYSNLYDQLDDVIKRAEYNQVKCLLTICTTLESFERIKLIINKIQKFFSKNNYNARVIYRTTQDAFGKESPDNLLPKKLLKYNVTVFINFKNHIISEDNVKEIFAFRDIDASKFKFIKKPHLHQNKVDLDLIDSKFKFKSIYDLIHNWDR